MDHHHHHRRRRGQTTKRGKKKKKVSMSEIEEFIKSLRKINMAATNENGELADPDLIRSLNTMTRDIAIIKEEWCETLGKDSWYQPVDLQEEEMKLMKSLGKSRYSDLPPQIIRRMAAIKKLHGFFSNEVNELLNEGPSVAPIARLILNRKLTRSSSCSSLTSSPHNQQEPPTRPVFQNVVIDFVDDDEDYKNKSRRLLETILKKTKELETADDVVTTTTTTITTITTSTITNTSKNNHNNNNNIINTTSTTTTTTTVVSKKQKIITNNNNNNNKIDDNEKKINVSPLEEYSHLSALNDESFVKSLRHHTRYLELQSDHLPYFCLKCNLPFYAYYVGRHVRTHAHKKSRANKLQPVAENEFVEIKNRKIILRVGQDQLDFIKQPKFVYKCRLCRSFMFTKHDVKSHIEFDNHVQKTISKCKPT